MPEYEMPGGETLEVPEGFSQAMERFGMTEREVSLEGVNDTTTILAPQAMGELPGEITSQRASIPRAIELFVKTPMEPLRLAIGDRPGPAMDPDTLEEAMNMPTNMPPTVAVPEGVEGLPFGESDRP